MPTLTVALDLPEHAIAALDQAAAERGVTRAALLAVLVESAAEGLRRPGSWERPHADALLRPLEWGAGKGR